MQDAGDRGLAASRDVGAGARDDAGRRQAAEQRRGDVGDALAEDLDVGAVPPAGDGVRRHRRQQAFDADQEGDREARSETRGRWCSSDRSGSFGAGSDAGMPPNRLPMVSTGRPSAHTAADAPTTAISKPGHFGRQRLQATMTASVARPTAKALTD